MEGDGTVMDGNYGQSMLCSLKRCHNESHYLIQSLYDLNSFKRNFLKPWNHLGDGSRLSWSISP